MAAERIGVTVGKFNPPHLGHLHLIATAAAQVDELYVMLGDRPDQTIPATDRARWLAAATPRNVTILITPDDLPAENGPWAQRALELLPVAPDVAFSSEPWGPEWAAAMGADHVSVDEPRESFPVSARRIRDDLRGEFGWLIPAARAALAKRVTAVGAESTGKTTLVRALAERFRTVWVPEYGRTYWEARRYRSDESWTSEEFRRIANVHHTIEEDLAHQAAGGLILLDTDALVTAVWHRRYIGGDDPALSAIAAAHRPDLYLVCPPEFDWVQDGTRESAGHRQAMHQHTLELVVDSGVPFAVITGSPEERLTEASRLIATATTFEPLI